MSPLTLFGTNVPAEILNFTDEIYLYCILQMWNMFENLWLFDEVKA